MHPYPGTSPQGEPLPGHPYGPYAAQPPLGLAPAPAGPTRTRTLVLVAIASLVAVVAGVAALAIMRSGGSGTHTERGLLTYAKGNATIVGSDGVAHSYRVTAGPSTQPAAMASIAASHRVVDAHVVDGAIDEVTIVPPPGKVASAPGVVAAVSDTSLTLRTAAGTVQFTIRARDAARMDVPHLREHMAGKAGVLIHYDVVGGAKVARSFEDAAAPVAGS